MNRLEMLKKGWAFAVVWMAVSAGGAVEVSAIPGGVAFRDGALVKRVISYGDGIVRVTARTGADHDQHGSLTVIAQPDTKAKAVRLGARRFRIGGLVVEAEADTLALSFATDDRRPILAESGVSEVKEITIEGAPTYEVRQGWRLEPDEAVYGLGQSSCGQRLNLRGQSVRLVQTNIPAYSPVLASSKGWMILWDIASQSRFSDKAKDGMTWWAESAPSGIDYYLMAGSNLSDAQRRYAALTGTAPLFPKKAYGFFMSKERYASRAELVDVVEKFRALHYPIDFIVQDWQYWNPANNMWNSAVFDERRYPDPKGMCDELHDRLHVGLMCSIWPDVGDASAVAKELDSFGGRYLQIGHWIPKGQSHVYDAFSKKAREVYFKHMYDGLISKGVDGLWMDGSEFETTTACHSHDEQLRDIKKIGRCAMGDLTRYLNAYSLMTTRGTYEGQRRVTDKRVLTLTRSFWAGQQRYGAMPWAGDTSASWTRLREDIAGGLGASLSGMPYWTQDTGGFFVNFPGGHQCKEYQELLARWNQFSVFSPVYRWHGTSIVREPWRFVDIAPEMYDSYLSACRLRYRLLPYIYSLASEAARTGAALTRPMVMDFPEEKELLGTIDEFMFGSALLVSPVTKAMYNIKEARGDTIPAECLKTPDGQPGAAVTYYRGTRFEEKACEQIESVIDNKWPGPPLIEWPKGLTGPDNFSLRAKTVVTFPESGEYALGVEGDDGFRMWLDGEKVVDDWRAGACRQLTVRRTWRAGDTAKVDIEFFNGTRDRVLRLVWIKPSTQARIDAERARIKKTKETALPRACGWYRFADGAFFAGGQTVEEECPIDHIPLYARAGSILPLGPVIEYAEQKTDEPTEIRVYEGADASFVLYDDDGRTYGYEKGEFAAVRLAWDDTAKTLTFGAREGKPYADAPDRMRFVVRFFDPSGRVTEKTVDYTGAELTILGAP